MKIKIAIVGILLLFLVYTLIRFNNILKIQKTIEFQSSNISRMIENSIIDSSINYHADSIYITDKFIPKNFGIRKINNVLIVYSFGFDKDDDNAQRTYRFETISIWDKIFIDGDAIIGVFPIDEIVTQLNKLKFKTKYFFKGNVSDINDSLKRYIEKQKLLIIKTIGAEIPIYKDSSLLNNIMNRHQLLINRDTFYIVQQKTNLISKHNFKIINSIVELYRPIIMDKQNSVDSIVTNIGIRSKNK